MPERDADLFKISIRQMPEHHDVDVVVSECCGVPLQANLREPLRDWLHCGSAFSGLGRVLNAQGPRRVYPTSPQHTRPKKPKAQADVLADHHAVNSCRVGASYW